jgi:hypothetical protein
MLHQRLPLVLVLVLAPATAAQSVYDFEGLVGSDVAPYAGLDGQDGWSEETFNAPNPCGVTMTLSHDGSQSLRFEEVGPGYGTDASRINDAAWSFPAFSGAESDAYFQADVHVGYWGGTFGPAHDVNGNGVIRGAEAGERGVRFNVGSHANVQLQLVGAGGVATTAQLAPLGIAGGNWVRLRIVMDLNGGGLGWLEYMNITAGDTAFQPVAALQGVPLGLVANATDATNPSLWDALWLHFEGATYGLDNVVLGELSIGSTYCSPAVSNSSGLPAELSASGSEVLANNDVNFVVEQLPPNQFGYFVMGQSQGFIAVGQGFLCISQPFVRFSQNILNSGNAGVMQFSPDLANLPSGTVFAVGDTWNFQCWFRDVNPGNTSNLSDAVALTFL